MANITITVPDAHLADIRDTLCAEWGYQDQVPNPNQEAGGTIPNPETKAAFLRRRMASIFKEYYMNAKARQSAAAADLASRQNTQDISFT